MDAQQKSAYEALYEGNKAKVRAAGDAMLAEVRKLGDDVTITVTGTAVKLSVEGRDFGMFTPSSGRRVTVRLRLVGTMQGRGRLESTAHLDPNGHYDTRAYISHPDHVDEDMRVALRRARDLAR